MKTALLVLLVALLLLSPGCTQKKAKPTPTPIVPTPPVVEATSPTPSASEPTVAPTPTPSPAPDAFPSGVPTPVPKACDNELQCIAGQPPKMCLNGQLVSFCQKCGCPSGKVCGRQYAFMPDDCFGESQITPFFVNASPYANSTLSSSTPTPSPTPSPTPKPCNATLADSGIAVFSVQVASAYNATFENPLRFDEVDEKTRAFYFQTGTLENRVLLYANKSAGLAQEGESDYNAFSSNRSCSKKIIVSQTGTAEKPFRYDFRMNCFNNSYLLDVRTKERLAPGDVPRYLGRRFAETLADYCG